MAQSDDAGPSELVRWGMNNGVAILVLIVCGIATRNIGIWASDNFFKPMRDAAITHLQNVDSTGDAIIKTMDAMRDSIDRSHAANQAKMDQILAKINERRERA